MIYIFPNLFSSNIAYRIFLQLSMWRCSDELRVHADELHRSSKRDAKHYIGTTYGLSSMIFASLLLYTILPHFSLSSHWCILLILFSEFWKQIPASEPYRVILGEVRDKLYNTRERSRQLLANGVSDIPEEATFTNVEDVCSFLPFSPIH